MKQINKLMMKAKQYEETKNPRKCAFLGMVGYSSDKEQWTAWVDVATRGEIKANKTPYKTLERITAAAPSYDEIMEKVNAITTQYHNDLSEPVILICDMEYAE